MLWIQRGAQVQVQNVSVKSTTWVSSAHPYPQYYHLHFI